MTATAPARPLRGTHICLPASGGPGPDPRFPKKYCTDPWCWSADLGFHRSSAPGVERFLLLAKDSRQVSGRRIAAVQAALLGAGAGTSRTPDPAAVFGAELAAVLRAAQPRHYRGDPLAWARFGHAARGKTWLDGNAPVRAALASELAGAADVRVPDTGDVSLAAVFDAHARTRRPLSCETDRLLEVLTGALAGL